MDSRFLDAFNQVLAHDLDKAMLLELLHADEELGYEELRKRIGSPSSQTYQYALDRLIDHALLNRRLEPGGGQRHETKLSPTQRGTHIAQTLHGLATRGEIPDKIQDAHREELRHAFQGHAPGANR